MRRARFLLAAGSAGLLVAALSAGVFANPVIESRGGRNTAAALQEHDGFTQEEALAAAQRAANAYFLETISVGDIENDLSIGGRPIHVSNLTLVASSFKASAASAGSYSSNKEADLWVFEWRAAGVTNPKFNAPGAATLSVKLVIQDGTGVLQSANISTGIPR